MKVMSVLLVVLWCGMSVVSVAQENMLAVTACAAAAVSNLTILVMMSRRQAG